MEINRKTWCKKSGCDGSVKRIEHKRLFSPYKADIFISYVCEKCGAEEITTFKLSSKLKKRLAKKMRGVD